LVADTFCALAHKNPFLQRIAFIVDEMFFSDQDIADPLEHVRGEPRPLRPHHDDDPCKRKKKNPQSLISAAQYTMRQIVN